MPADNLETEWKCQARNRSKRDTIPRLNGGSLETYQQCMRRLVYQIVFKIDQVIVGIHCYGQGRNKHREQKNTPTRDVGIQMSGREVHMSPHIYCGLTSEKCKASTHLSIRGLSTVAW